jgi:hypothetical protein
MRLTVRDAIATFLVAAILVPYVGYLINGSMPFIQDPRGMSGVGLIFGVAAAAIGGWIVRHEGQATWITTVGLAVVSAVLGVLTLLSENLFDATTSAVLLGAFMASIVVQWGLALLRHGGIVRMEGQPTSRLGHA